VSADYAFPNRDTGFNVVVFDHLQRSFRGGLDWSGAPIAWPFSGGSALADWMAGPAALTLPFHHLGVSPHTTYMIASLLGLLLTALVVQEISRRLVGPGIHTVIAGVLGGLAPLQLAHAHHVNLVHHELAVAAAAFLAAGLVQRRPVLMFLAGLASGLSFHFGVYVGLHAGVAVVAVSLALVRGLDQLPRLILAFGLGVLVVAATLVAPAEMYLEARSQFSAVVPVQEIVQDSWDPLELLSLTPDAPAHELVRQLIPASDSGAPVDPANPGFLALLLALVAIPVLRRSPLRRYWGAILLTGAFGAVIALGPVPSVAGFHSPVPGPHRLLEMLTGGNLRSPSRWLVLMQMAVGLVASAGAGFLIQQAPSRFRLPAGVALVALVCLELPTTSAAPVRALLPSRAYAALDDIDLESPLYERIQSRSQALSSARLFAAPYHGRPLVGGHYARFSDSLQILNRTLATWPSSTAIELLRILDVQLVLEHPPLSSSPPVGPECRLVGEHRLCTLPRRSGSIPCTESVATEGSGPVIGVRWLVNPQSEDVSVACGGAEPESYGVSPWLIASRLRHDVSRAPLEIFLDTPCPTQPVVSDGIVVSLHLAPSSTCRWLPPLPPRGRSIRGLLSSIDPPDLPGPTAPNYR